MKIVFFSESQINGKIPRDFPNARTEYAWMMALDAPHFNVHSQVDGKYDLGIVIIPKTNPNINLDEIRKSCDKVAVMQEGPHWYFQDYPMEHQVWFYNSLVSVDVIFAHNQSDVNYYKGLTNKNHVYQNKSLMIENNIKPTTKPENRSGVIIGGNFCRWYGGFDSYIVAQQFETEISIPSMGRKVEGEEGMPNLKHLPYMDWCDWINNLSQYKYGVHLMPTQAAGTFALNCAYHGIPCIGYEGLDTQELCFPHLTIEMGNLNKAKQLAERLKTDEDFYNDCSKIAKTRYTECFSVDEYTKNMYGVIKKVINENN